MTVEIYPSDNDDEVVLEFMYETYAFSPEKAESMGKELIKQAAIAKYSRNK